MRDTDCVGGRVNVDQWTTAAQDEGEWCRTAKQGVERSMANSITAEKIRTGRHAVVCPNVTGRTKDRIAQSKSMFGLVHLP